MENQRNHYVIYYKDEPVAHFHTYEDGTYAYGPNLGLSEETLEELKALGLGEARKGRRPPKALSALMAKKQRVPERKRVIYLDGPLKMEKKPASIPAGSFSVYDRRARKGAPDYSELPHDAPHYEGPNTPEGMREWASFYRFDKKDDGTYEAVLDEAWWWGGGHNDGGTMHAEIPEEWFALPYEEFIDRVLTLVSAAHYGFTREILLERKGLKEFFEFS